MTVTASIDPARLLEEQLAQASPDLLRELLTTFVNTLMSAEADAVQWHGRGCLCHPHEDEPVRWWPAVKRARAVCPLAYVSQSEGAQQFARITHVPRLALCTDTGHKRCATTEPSSPPPRRPCIRLGCTWCQSETSAWSPSGRRRVKFRRAVGDPLGIDESRSPGDFLDGRQYRCGLAVPRGEPVEEVVDRWRGHPVE